MFTQWRESYSELRDRFSERWMNPIHSQRAWKKREGRMDREKLFIWANINGKIITTIDECWDRKTCVKVKTKMQSILKYLFLSVIFNVQRGFYAQLLYTEIIQQSFSWKKGKNDFKNQSLWTILRCSLRLLPCLLFVCACFPSWNT